MTIIIITIIAFLLGLPFIFWLEKNSIKNEDLQGIEDWHNFKKALKK